MMTHQESLEILKSVASNFPILESETVPLAKAVGRILWEDIAARENNPPFDNSAMDGFALHFDSLPKLQASADGWIPVQVLISAGDRDFQIQKEEAAIEIMTGAPIPDAYFDTVIKVEDVEQKRDKNGVKWIRIQSQPRRGDHIRRCGEDTRVGDLLLSKNQRLNCEHLLALATQGISFLKVKRRVQVAILSTGKEVVPFESPKLDFGQIRNSTGIYLQTVLSHPALKVVNEGIIKDDPDLYVQKLGKIFNDDTDILISTGAVSMGVHDFVRPALESLGAMIHFHKCAIRPGKPVLFATLDWKGKRKFLFGVPGNPVSTAVGLRFFVKPFVDLLLSGEIEKPIHAVLTADTQKPEGLKCFFKAKVDLENPEPSVESLKGQASFMVAPFIQSNAWVVFPEPGEIIKQGTKVEVFTL